MPTEAPLERSLPAAAPPGIFVERDRSQPAAFIKPDSGVPSGRLLISLFATNSISVFRSLLGALCADGDGLQFSIDGIVASAVGPVATVSVVVRPVESLRRSRKSGPEVKAELKRRLSEALDAVPSKPEFMLWELSGSLGSSLFRDRVLHEFRFGLSLDGSLVGASKLSTIALNMANLLAEQGVPIAYAVSPVEWNNGLPEDRHNRVQWLRIAIGLPYGSTEPIELQLGAYGLARDYGAYLALYNPASPGMDLSSRFELVVQPSDEDAVKVPFKAPSTPVFQNDGLSYLFADRRAAPGVLANMLQIGAAAGASILGFSMAVIEGRTVAAFVTDRDGVDAFNAGLAQAERGAKTHPVGSHEITPPRAAMKSPQGELWISWEFDESPGIVDALVAAVENITSHAASSPDRVGTAAVAIEYLVSRVDPRTGLCAGKMRLSMDGELAHQMVARAESTEEAVLKSMRTRLALRGASRQRLLVTPDEADEEPWATLVVP